MKYKMLLIIILCFIPSFVFAQKGGLKVFVQDSSKIKHPMLPNFLLMVKMRLISEKDSTQFFETPYHHKGYFSFKNIPIGKYKILLNNNNCYGKLNSVEIVKGKTQEINLPVFNHVTTYGCYKCKSKDLIPIIYGFSITDQEKELQKQGKLIWLGCVVMEKWYCKSCKKKIY